MRVKTRLYNIWKGMKARCYNQKSGSGYKRYGALGICVCDEWRGNFDAFNKWANENGYADHLTLDRRECNGNYTPGNCRWATRAEQMMNRRKFDNCSSKFKGVSWNKKDQRWKAGINVEGKWTYLGNFTSEVEAAQAYDSEARRLFGEYAHLNFPQERR